MVCLRNISVDTLHNGDTEDDNDDDDDDNDDDNNNNNLFAESHYRVVKCLLTPNSHMSAPNM
jgi:hypothetical protein